MNSPPAPEAAVSSPPPTRGGILRNPFVWFFLIGIVTLTALRPFLRHEPDPPPVIGQLPEFSLVDETGQPFGSAELAGTVYVANFVFTRCTTICPYLTGSMKKLQQRFDDEGVNDVRMISISVDPEYDTPERLSEYARGFGARPERWKFLTGTQDEIERLVVGGFRTAMGGPVAGDETPIDIAHSAKFVLVDGSGGIRGYYGSDEMGLDEIFHRSQHVVRESSR